MKKSLILFLIILSCNYYSSVAQDIRGGEIHYSSISLYEYSFDIYLYTQTSLGIDRSREIFIPLNGHIDTLTGTATHYSNDITQWHYTCTAAYTNSGTYNVFLADSFRVANIQN